jgi:pyridoxal phosphate enzyme (YggS family)
MEEVLRRNLDAVRERMAAACERAGRQPDDVLLVAVVKTVGPEVVRALPSLGVTDVGENRVQQARGKQEALGGTAGLTWHMVGHVQTNKVRHALRVFKMFQSVDSLRLAEEIDRRAEREGLRVPVLVQCNVSGEESKSGVGGDKLRKLLEQLLPLDNVRVRGLMTMAPLVEDPEETRPWFAALRELAEKARTATGLPMPHLSMGMTQDFEVAIEEGATMVRIGTALFGGLRRVR